ncbi:hypothetical protein [Butyrivibrio sp. AE2032]|uniref:hypothetical protein n=1 Tax=Butyrivibrio sp. AE2032 TaxID=1458463 RepID=UPI000558971A|nr:hypothetical protein [Butyrivibrio sp. AE2032]
MKLREKWAKQNNSVKLLLRKLKRHDTVVVAIAVVMAMILCGGLIYFSTPVVTANAKQELEESERQNNEKTIEKLDELSEYLDGLDKSITDSKDSISSYYEKAGKDSTLVNEKNTEKITNNVNEKVTGLGNNLNTLHETIESTQTNIDRLKEIIEKNDQAGTQDRERMLAEIGSELDNIKDQHSQAQQNTKELIKELEKLLGKQNEDLSKQSKDQNDALTQQSKEQGEALTKQLKDQGEALSKQSKEEKDELSQQLKDQGEALSKQSKEEKDELSQQLKNQSDALSKQSKEEKGALSQQGKDQTDKLSKEIQEGNDKLFEKVESDDKALSEQLTSSKNELSEQLTNSRNDLSTQMSDGNSTLSKEMKEQYQALLKSLTESDKKLSEQNSEMLTSFQSEINKLSAELTKILAQMNTNVDEMGKSITNNINAGNTENKKRFDTIDTNITGVNNKIDANFSSINTTVQGDFDQLKSYMDKQNAHVNERLDEVFGRVSKGKKLLASALLTKNVSIREDASFAEIAEAITKIPTQIVLDNGDMAGKVEYVIHYHTDGTTAECGDDYVPVERKGGCFNEPYYHKHNGDCYTPVTVYSYSTNKGVEKGGPTGETWGGETVFKYNCPMCGRFTGTNRWHGESTTDINVANDRHKGEITTTVQMVLNCDLPEGELIGYKPDCKMVHGQIVAAKITFADQYTKYNHVTQMQPSSNSSTNLATSHMMVTSGSNLFEGLTSRLVSFGGNVDLLSGFDMDDEFDEESEAEPEDEISEDKVKELSAETAELLEGEDAVDREDSSAKENLTSDDGNTMSIVPDSDLADDKKTEVDTDDQTGNNSLQDEQGETDDSSGEKSNGLDAENADK